MLAGSTPLRGVRRARARALRLPLTPRRSVHVRHHHRVLARHPPPLQLRNHHSSCLGAQVCAKKHERAHSHACKTFAPLRNGARCTSRNFVLAWPGLPPPPRRSPATGTALPRQQLPPRTLTPSAAAQGWSSAAGWARSSSRSTGTGSGRWRPQLSARAAPHALTRPRCRYGRARWLWAQWQASPYFPLPRSNSLPFPQDILLRCCCCCLSFCCTLPRVELAHAKAVNDSAAHSSSRPTRCPRAVPHARHI